MPFVDTTTGRSHSINEVHEPRPLWRHLKARIELAADVSISLASFDDEDFGKGWCAIASKQTDHAYAGGMTSRTVASVWADGPFRALDKLAAQLGVKLNDDADTVAEQRSDSKHLEAV
jgi:hypothetical protein